MTLPFHLQYLLYVLHFISHYSFFYVTGHLLTFLFLSLPHKILYNLACKLGFIKYFIG